MRRNLLYAILTSLAFFQILTTNAQVSVTATAGTTSGSYATLGAAFAAINSGTHQGTITITLTGSTAETVSASLDSSGNTTGSGYTSVSIAPASGTPVTITGNVAGPLINLNGADNVTIDGFALAPGGATLTITNISTAATASTMMFINDATSNTVKNTTLKGAGASISTGVVVFNTGLATGNDNNTLLNDDIDCTGSAGVGLYSSGSTSSTFVENSANAITNCWIHDFFNPTLTTVLGAYLAGGNRDWTFTGNSFYQSVPRVVSANTVFYGMYLGLSYASDKHVVTGNFIGGSGPGASNSSGNMELSGATTFTAGFFGFNIQTSGAGSLVDGNIVRNITLTSQATGSYTNAAFYGYSSSANGTTTFSNNQVTDINLINNTSGGYISFQCIHVNGRVTSAGTTVAPNFTISNNLISNIVGSSSANADFEFHGIRLETSSGNSLATGTSNPTFNVSANTISSITLTTTGTGTYLRGIGTINTNGTSSTAALWPKVNLTNNIIRNFAAGGALALYTGFITASGIHFTGSSNINNTTDIQTISGNEIYNIGATTTADVANHVSGIIATAGVFIIEKNRIYGLSNTSAGTTTTPIISGINLRSTLASSSIRNNFISLSGGQNTNTFGILNNFSSANPINIYFNSVYITGTGGVRNSVGFYRGNEAMSGAITSTVDIKDNIFYNFRSGGTGSNYAIGSYGIGTWTSDYNILKSTVTTTVATWNNTSMDLPAYQAASGQDAHSKNITVTFVDPATADLHLSGASNGDANLRGVPVAGITTDYDNQTRSSFNPYIGADEASISLPVQILAFTGNKEGRLNKLEWSTSTEINNKGFELQRSADGKNFSQIAFVASKADKGNSSYTLNYAFTDEKSLSGTNYYRLKQVDNDGKFAYSSVLVLKGDKVFNISALYPSPARDQISVSVSSEKNEKAIITIVDITGKVMQQINTALVAGDNNIKLNIGSFSAGTYYLKLAVNDQVKTTSFMKQ